MTIRVAFECPINSAAFKMIEPFQDYVFALQQFMVEEIYATFVRDASNKGLKVYLDNGAFEGVDLNIDKYIGYAKYINADILVAPDKIGDGTTTIDKIKEFKATPGVKGLNCQLMGVVHGKTAEEWIETYEELSKLVDIIGIPYISYPSTANTKGFSNIIASSSRAQFLIYLRRNNLIKRNQPHHFLGLNNMLELPILKSLNLDSTLDTSFPFMAVQHGLEVKKDLNHPPRKSHMRLDFRKKHTQSEYTKVVYLMRLIKKTLNS